MTASKLANANRIIDDAGARLYTAEAELERKDAKIAMLRGALNEIANLSPDMIDVLPLDKAFSTVRQLTKIAREALKE